MATACDYNCTELPEHEKVQCGAHRKGGISAIGVLECNHTITDFTSASQAYANILAGKLTIIAGIKGEFAAASPIEGENPEACGATTILDGFDYVFNFKDFHVTSSNDSFYEALNKRSSYVVFFYCQDDEIRVVERKVVWSILPPISPESNKEKQMYTGTIKWSSDVDEFPTLYTAPDAIYE